jgi:hypothetical protein
MQAVPQDHGQSSEHALDGPPPTDESRDVDLALIRHNLTLTPAQRLKQLEEFVSFITEARRLNGLE